MIDILSVLVAIIICGLLFVVAYLETELNIVKRKLADIRFLYDLRK